MIKQQPEVTPEARGLAGLVTRKLKSNPELRRSGWDYDNKIMHIGAAKRGNDLEKLRCFLKYIHHDFSNVSTAVEGLRRHGHQDIVATLDESHLQALITIRELEALANRPPGKFLSPELLLLIAATPDDLNLWVHIIYDRKIMGHKRAAAMYEELKSCTAPALAMGLL